MILNKAINRYSICKRISALCLVLLFAALTPLQAMAFDNAGSSAKLTRKEVSVLSSYPYTAFVPVNSYHASVSYTNTFWDYKSCYNVAEYNPTTKVLSITRFNEKLVKKSAIKLKNPYSLFGDVICDDEGYIYVLWGQDDTKNKNKIVTSLVKYNYKGKVVGRLNIRGYECSPRGADNSNGDYWGTQFPFHAGTCEMEVANGVLTCNYARKMYSGHQSNFVFYADTKTMKRLYENEHTPYVSHSFDQDVIPTSDGGFLYANQGDAYSRGFELSYVKDGDILGERTTFHFREGSNRSYGYNETFAQLGGVCETNNTYVLCGSSERTLSLAVAPTNGAYLGHSQARDLFVQIVKKDFYNYSKQDMYYVQGSTRKPTGKRTSNAQTPLWLWENDVDYGVIWLTKLSKSSYVANPKVVSVGNGKIVILWQELSYSSNQGNTYYTVLNENGKTLVKKTKLSNVSLPGNTDLTIHKNRIYWVTKDVDGNYIYSLKI